MEGGGAIVYVQVELAADLDERIQVSAGLHGRLNYESQITARDA